MASNAPRKSLPRDEGFRTQENYLADHPEDDFNDLPDQLLRAIRVQCDLENAMELSGLTMLSAAQSSLAFQMPQHKQKSSKKTSSSRRSSRVPPQRRGSTTVDIVKALQRLVMGSTSKDKNAASQTTEDVGSRVTPSTYAGRKDSSQTSPRLRATKQEGHSAKTSMDASHESASLENSGYESSGGAPSRGITDDEAEDSDAENEALRSSRAGSRRRRRTRRRRQNKSPTCSDSELVHFDKTLELKPPLQDQKDASPSGLSVQKDGGLRSMSGRFDEGVNRTVLDEVWADLDDVNSSSFHIAAMQCQSFISTNVAPPMDATVESPGPAEGSTDAFTSRSVMEPQLGFAAGAAASSRCVTRVVDPQASSSASNSPVENFSVRGATKKPLLVPIASAPSVPKLLSCPAPQAMQMSRSISTPLAAFKADTIPVDAQNNRWAQPVPFAPQVPFYMPPLLQRAQSCPVSNSAAEEGAVWGDAAAEWAADDGGSSNLGSGDWGNWKEVSVESPVKHEPPAINALPLNVRVADEKAKGFGWADESFDGAFFPFFPSEGFAPITNADESAASTEAPTSISLLPLVVDAQVTPRRQFMPNASFSSTSRSAVSLLGPAHYTDSSPISVTYPPSASMASPLAKRAVMENMSQELTQEAAAAEPPVAKAKSATSSFAKEMIAPNLAPKPAGATSTAAAEVLLEAMPSFKRQPIGKTGVRFVIEHNFVTSSGSMYQGFSLQFPKCFGIKAQKGKDFARIVSNRNEKLRSFAESSTSLTPDAFDSWLVALDHTN